MPGLIRSSAAPPLAPARVALIGASERSRFTAQFLAANDRLGRSPDDIVLVNRSGAAVFGRPAIADLEELDEPIDAGVVVVPAAAVTAAAASCLRAGAGHLVVHASGFEDRNSPEVIALVDEVERAGATMIGPNCMGWLNLNHRFSLYGGHLPSTQTAGPISFVVQSGSAAISCLNASAGLGVDCLISTGNELVTTLEDCMEALIHRDETEVIALYVEQLRAPRRFLARALDAVRAGKRIVVLKTGRSAVGAQMSQSHTGALAGEAKVYSAAFRDVGVVEASSFEEFFAAITLSRSRVATLSSARSVFVGISGGELSHVADLAEAAGVPPATLSDATGTAIGSAMGLDGPPASVNPVDIGARDPKQRLTFAEVQDGILHAVAADDGCDMVALAVNFASSFDPEQVATYQGMANGGATTLAAFPKPAVVLSAPSLAVHPDLRRPFDDVDVPVLRGARDSFGAIAALVKANVRVARIRSQPARDDAPGPRPTAALDELLRDHRASRRAPLEPDVKAVLRSYGVQTPAEAPVASAAEAVAAAERLGFPLVVKIAVADISHKSDVGGVILDIRSTDELVKAIDVLDGRLSQLGAVDRGYLVCEQVSASLELIAGARYDRDFGPVVAVGLGGVLVELVQSVELGLAPRTVDDAALLLEESSVLGRLLDGFRGSPPIDRLPIAECLVRLGEIVRAGDGVVTDIEINPLAVSADRPPVALDARMSLALPASSS